MVHNDCLTRNIYSTKNHLTINDPYCSGGINFPLAFSSAFCNKIRVRYISKLTINRYNLVLYTVLIQHYSERLLLNILSKITTRVYEVFIYVLKYLTGLKTHPFQRDFQRIRSFTILRT